MVADVLDTITFSNPKNNDERISLVKKIKEHIVENGGVYTAIKAPDIGNFKFIHLMELCIIIMRNILIMQSLL